MQARFDPEDYWRLAKQIANDADADECAYRAAIGRAYYAMFLIARENFNVKRTTGAHGEVRRMIRQKNSTLSDQFFALMQLREVADYELIPVEASNRDWCANWERASAIADRLIGRLKTMRR